MPYVLLLHGHMGAAPPHWQSWLAHELDETGCDVDVPQFSEPDQPRLDVWLAELRSQLVAAPVGTERIVLAHSCGAALWLHHAARLADPVLRFDRVLLVAPPGPRWRHPDVHGFNPAPLDAAGVRRAASWTQLVVGDDDQACSVDEAVDMASALKVDLDVIPEGAHLDGHAGYGPWPSVRDWVADRHTRMVSNR
ncbi:RBBP9/YdeN family alpha/beta hydrolase [Actinophytocola sp.]|uniref:RBBP9/YdeN family alpha/beta hydrolase n=1 Tax=Actinophytocola sp. TaxID=1872138 RepID=UPI00389B24B1